MKYIAVTFMIMILAVLVLANTNQADSNKKKATFIEEGKGVQSEGSAIEVDKNAAGYIKIQQNGERLLRKSKEREGMGSAASSGPAVKIQKIDTRPTVSMQEVIKSLDNDGDRKKRRDE